MPIDYAKYPDNWNTEIRPRELKRAGWKCEECSAINNAVGYRDPGGNFIEADEHIQQWCKSNGIRVITIRLSVCHIEHDITKNEPGDLSVMCQKCHVNHDKEKHVLSRKINRAIKQNTKQD